MSTQAHYRDYTDAVQLSALRIRMQKQLENISTKTAPTTDLSAGSWELKLGAGTELIAKRTAKKLVSHCKLADLIKGVACLTQGRGRRRLSTAIEHAQAHGNDLLLS